MFPRFETEGQFIDSAILFAPNEKKKEREDWEERNPRRSGPQPGDPGSERNVGDGHALERDRSEEHNRIPKKPCPQKGN
jgi:hypothetical protein